MKKLVAVAVVLFACGGKDDSSSGGTAKKDGDKPGAKPSPAMPTPTPPAADVHMSCDKLVAKAIIDKYLGGLDLDVKHAQQRGAHLNCQWKRNEPMAVVSINFECKERVYDAMAQTIAMMKDQKVGNSTAKEIAGVGKGAVSITEGQVNFWASNARCMVNIVAVGDSPLAKDPVPLAKDLDAALSPASLQ